MAVGRIALLFLVFFIFSVDGKPTKTPTVTFRGSGRTTPGPDNAGANNNMYRVVLPIFGVLVVAAVIFGCYKYMAWRRREKKQETDLQMVRVEKPAVQKPVAQIAKKDITPAMHIIKKEKTIIERLKAAKREEEKIIKREGEAQREVEKIIKKGGEAPKEEEKIVKRTSHLKKIRKWMKKRTQKKKNVGKGKE